MKELACPACGKRMVDDGSKQQQCPDCGRRFLPGDASLGSVRLMLPGAGLILVGCLGIFGNCLCGVGSMAWPRDDREFAFDEIDENARRGRAAAPLLNACVAAVPAIFLYPVVILGGMRMRSVQGYPLAVTASVLAMLPCSPVFVFGLPIGIWSLMVLRDLEVRRCFAP